MYGLVTHDLIWDDTLTTNTREGHTWGTWGGAQPIVANTLYVWRTLDDDREPYYMGIADDEALEPIYEWAMRDAGCTILQVLDLMTLTWKDELS